VVIAAAFACGSREAVRLATTTSVDNSGLLAALLEPYREEVGASVEVLAVGSGRAIQLLRRGDADIALTHDPAAETVLLAEAPGTYYRKLMFNDFIVVGPPSDEAEVRRATTAAQAMRLIAVSSATFVSRGDESGTHARERQLWAQVGVKPSADRLLETGQGMAATVRIASERHAYTLTDRATFMQLAQVVALEPLFQHDPALLNTYAAIVLRGTRRERDALRFMTWLSDGNGRTRIASFTVSGLQPFVVWPAGRPRDTPEALPR
jgi:tungstate transport system substrate-binding protein